MNNADQGLDVGTLKPLSPYLDGGGKVNYAKIQQDTWLKEQWDVMAEKDLSSSTRADRFAFWMNAYNLFTIKGVLMEFNKNPQWQGNTSPISKLKFFILRKFRIARRSISLNMIETQILRGKFKDPRVHFAINCGSGSCLELFDRLYRGDMLDRFLDKVCRMNINDPGQVYYDEEKNILFISRIFKWYKQDFQNVGGIKAFIKQYWEGSEADIDRAKIKYFEYDWTVNAQ